MNFFLLGICTWYHCLLAVSSSASGVCVVRWWWWWWRALNSCSAHWTLRQHRNNHFYLYNCYLVDTCCLLIDYTIHSAEVVQRSQWDQARGEHWAVFDLENSSNYQLNSSFFLLVCAVLYSGRSQLIPAIATKRPFKHLFYCSLFGQMLFAETMRLGI